MLMRNSYYACYIFVLFIYLSIHTLGSLAHANLKNNKLKNMGSQPLMLHKWTVTSSIFVNILFLKIRTISVFYFISKPSLNFFINVGTQLFLHSSKAFSLENKHDTSYLPRNNFSEMTMWDHQIELVLKSIYLSIHTYCILYVPACPRRVAGKLFSNF